MSIAAAPISDTAISDHDARQRRRAPTKRRVQSLADRIADPEPR